MPSRGVNPLIFKRPLLNCFGSCQVDNIQKLNNVNGGLEAVQWLKALAM